MPAPNRLAVRIRDIRMSHHLSQADFGASVGVSENTVHNWETGRTKRFSKGLLRLIELEYNLVEHSLLDLYASVTRQRFYNERRRDGGGGQR